MSVSRSAEPDRSPKPTGSLFEAWLPKFMEAKTDERLSSLCIQGETALLRYRGQYKAEVHLPPMIDGEDKDAMRKVCEVFVGDDPVEVSRKLAGQVSPGWVEKARMVNRRNVADGSQPSGWRGWDDEERNKRIAHAREHNWSIRRAAEAFGMPFETFRRNHGHLLT